MLQTVLACFDSLKLRRESGVVVVASEGPEDGLSREEVAELERINFDAMVAPYIGDVVFKADYASSRVRHPAARNLIKFASRPSRNDFS